MPEAASEDSCGRKGIPAQQQGRRGAGEGKVWLP